MPTHKMSDNQLNSLIHKITDKKTLFGLSMQPKKYRVGMGGEKLAISDINVYDEWLNTQWIPFLNDPKQDSLDQFTKKLNVLLAKDNRTQEYRLAMAKVIRASFETGQFVAARDTRPLRDFLRKNPDIAEFMDANINALNEASQGIEAYVKTGGIVKKPETDLERQLQKAKKTIINHLKTYKDELGLKQEIFSEPTAIKILPKSLIPFRVQKLQEQKKMPGFNPRIKRILDRLDFLEQNLKHLTGEYLKQRRGELGTQKELTGHIQFKAMQVLRMAQDKATKGILTILEMHGIRSGDFKLLTKKNEDGKYLLMDKDIKEFQAAHPRASKEILPLLRFENDILDSVDIDLIKSEKDALYLGHKAINELAKNTQDLPPSAWLTRFVETIKKVWNKAFEDTHSESNKIARAISIDIKQEVFRMEKLENAKPLLKDFDRIKNKNRENQSETDKTPKPGSRP